MQRGRERPRERGLGRERQEKKKKKEQGRGGGAGGGGALAVKGLQAMDGPFHASPYILTHNKSFITKIYSYLYNKNLKRKWEKNHK